MNFDLNTVPFSRRESFLAISRLPEAANRKQGLYLRTVRGGDDKFGEAFRIELTPAHDAGSAAAPAPAAAAPAASSAAPGPEPAASAPVASFDASASGDAPAHGVPAVSAVAAPTEPAAAASAPAPATAAPAAADLLPFAESAAPESLRLEAAPTGGAEIALPDGRTARFRARGVGVRLTFASASAYDYALEHAPGRWEVNSFTHECRFMLTLNSGEALRMEVPWDRVKSSRIVAAFEPDAATGELEFAVEEFRTVPRPPREWPPFDDDVARVRAEFAAWLDGCPSAASPRWEEARRLAAYITWSCLVPAEGCLTRPAMYMSKNWMTNIWSWDHCFNAMALVRHDPALAWDQLMIFFDRQDESGLLPDFINDKYELWNCNKPPIHGWTLDWMMRRTDLIDDGRLREIYGPLGKWTRWWFEHRDGDGDGIPQYNHGNDSGWDNSTVFNRGIPVESPDLAAFLVLQTEVLGTIAARLGLGDEAAAWNALSAATLDRLVAHFWQDGRFRAMRSGTHEPADGDSLVLFMPIVLGKRLPAPIREALLRGLREEGRFLTANGWATESVSSPYYEPDGYWRGPIWAPSTMLLVSGVAAAGDEELAREAARRFCAMASRSGMAENYDALTGAGLRDRAFTWTSSVYLILAAEYAVDAEAEAAAAAAAAAEGE